MEEVLRTAHQAAKFDASVLITGESGTGKELTAQEIHRVSPRSQGPFVAINCGAIPHGLLESEQFGHAKGAFTGADSERPGLFEEADGGTLLLDEIGSLILLSKSSCSGPWTVASYVELERTGIARYP